MFASQRTRNARQTGTIPPTPHVILREFHSQRSGIGPGGGNLHVEKTSVAVGGGGGGGWELSQEGRALQRGSYGVQDR